MNKKNIVTWVLFFLIFFLGLQLFFNKKPAAQDTASAAPLVATISATEYVSGSDIAVKVKNNTAAPLTISSKCPKNPLDVFKLTGDKFEEITKESPIDCKKDPDIVIQPNVEQAITFPYWNHALFSEPGKYKIEVHAEKLTASTAEFTVTEPGLFRKAFRAVFYQPIYNLLVLAISFAPLHDLGFAIIILTLIIRLILLVPSQRAIVSQRRMQEIQPKLEEVKKKYEGNQERIASETMNIWKQNKVNPFGSCLPTLIQFPVLIALYYVIRSGLNPDNAFMVYAPLKNVDLLNLHTNFLGILELTKVNTIILPLIVGLLQFVQMKLAMSRKKPGAPTAGNEMETASRTMIYIMPVMIAMFTASVPAGVGLYWGISTAFGIVQQYIANRSSDSNRSVSTKIS